MPKRPKDPAVARVVPSAVAKVPRVAEARPMAPLKESFGPPVAERMLRMAPTTWVEQAMRLTSEEAREKARNLFLSKLGLFVLLPTLLTALYVYVYATPRYVSEFQITYQSNDATASAASTGLLSSIMGTSGTTMDMPTILQAYLTSSTVADIVDKEVGFRDHYSSRKIDWLDRLSKTASAEKYLIYFNRRVAVTRQFGGYVSVDVEAFDPAFAQKVGKALVKAADTMVAGMMERSRSDAVGLADKELNRTEDVLRKATLDMTAFRNKHGDVNIHGTANSLDSVVSSLESQVSQANSELANAKTFLSDTAPSIVSLNSRITALKNEISAERKKLGYADGASSTAKGKLPYSQVIAEYTALETEQKFATDSYVSAKKAYDVAKSMAAQKSGYIVSFVPPSLPQSSTAPDPLTYILSAFLISLGGYMVATLMIGTFKDRAGA